MIRPSKTALAVAALSLLSLFITSARGGQIVNNRYSFGVDGAYPGSSALTLGSDGSLYGTTQAGGSQDKGTVFKITPSGIETVIYSFGANPNDGSSPEGGVTLGVDGNFYGTTVNGGTQSSGTFFKVTPSGVETVLYSFGTNSNDGASPYAAPILGSDGNFYGTTSAGGSQSDGTVYKITPLGAETVLYSFGADSNDGSTPYFKLVLGGDGNFYGTTSFGGSYGKGTVFSITPLGAETVLYSFGSAANEPTSPTALILGADGNFYGMCYSGGSHNVGAFFSLTTLGVETTIYNFGEVSNDGANPGATLVLGLDGNFYGTTSSGGSHGSGTVVQIATAGVETVVYNFGENSGDGASPGSALTQDASGVLYGLTNTGGGQGVGTLYSIALSTPAAVETIIHSFGANNVERPEGALIQGTDGNFYGTSYSGGSQNLGTVFQITPSGSETLLYSFGTNSDDGANPQAALTQGSDGSFYGTTAFGGNGGNGSAETGFGTVFKIGTDGAETVLYRFGTNSASDGNNPTGPLTLGADGNFYGSTTYGGDQGAGTIFKITPSGDETVLYSFGANLDDGAYPQLGALTQDSDGNFYGTTAAGGTFGQGAIFKITTSGDETVIYSFGANASDGSQPLAGLTPSGGLFYGTTSTGGHHGKGTFFSVTPSGTEKVLYSFGANPDDGTNLNALVVSDSGNVFYGTAYEGGANETGTIFSVTPEGTETVLYTFPADLSGGQQPFSGLVQGSDGTFYGTTEYGGAADSGVFFQFSPGDALVAENDRVVLTNGSPITINVLANDFTLAEFPLTITAVTHPSLGRAKINANGTITYTPNLSFAKFSGTDSFTYTISDGVSSATATVTIGNPFYLQKGNFAGVLTGLDGGYLTLALTNTGAFTGALRIGTTRYTLKGQLGPDGSYTATVGGQSLVLQVDVSQLGGDPSGGYEVDGSYGGDSFAAYHAVYNSVTNPAPEAGYYTLLLPAADSTDPTVPSGTGYATLKVGEGGSISITGALADGTSFSDGVFITGGNTLFIDQFPIYIPVKYKSAGLLVGVMAFEAVAGVSDCDGELFWLKPSQTKGLYKSGFTTTLLPVGSRYAAPLAGNLALDLTGAAQNATITLSEPDFTGDLVKNVLIGFGKPGVNTATVNNPAADLLTMSIKASTGIFSGTIIDPISNKSTKIQGALLYKQSIAGGYFLSPTQSGSVMLQGN